MTIEKKLLGTSPSGGAANVAEVFSTFLYTGAGGTQTITNGIDLSGEGGLVWVKHRTAAIAHMLVDTERGVKRSISSNTSAAQTPANANNVDAFYSTGFQVGPDASTNQPNGKFASWTFRKKEKFFDIVTYTGNYVAGREIPHGLGGPVGMLVVKKLNAGDNWKIWHRSVSNKTLILNNLDAASTSNAAYYFGNDSSVVNPTSTNFTVGTASDLNSNGSTYVAYLFADNSSEDADDQMIKCGSYTTDGSGNATIDLGWEPQFVITKKTNGTGDWNIWDTMRGWSNGSNYDYIVANTTAAETGNSNYGNPTSTGFTSNGVIGYNSSGIYMAIRAPMMKEPEAATDVFGMSNAMTQPLPAFNSTFPVDMSLNKRPAYGQNNAIGSRLQGTKHLYTDTTGAEVNEVEYVWDFMDGWGGFNSSNSDYQSWNWKRAKGYMDVVCYKGTGSARTQAHSLGVVPEMMWVFNRAANYFHPVYHKALPITQRLQGEDVDPAATQDMWNSTTPTDSLLSVSSHPSVNASNGNYIAILFATLAGISKCGSYTGNGSYQTISCGFSAGSRFVLIKRTDASGDWFYWDSVRGIVAGNDPHLSLNTLSAQVTSDDSVDPHNSGFIVNQVSATNINVSSGTYIFYAIA